MSPHTAYGTWSVVLVFAHSPVTSSFRGTRNPGYFVWICLSNASGSAIVGAPFSSVIFGSRLPAGGTAAAPPARDSIAPNSVRTAKASHLKTNLPGRSGGSVCPLIVRSVNSLVRSVAPVKQHRSIVEVTQLEGIDRKCEFLDCQGSLSLIPVLNFVGGPPLHERELPGLKSLPFVRGADRSSEQWHWRIASAILLMEHRQGPLLVADQDQGNIRQAVSVKISPGSVREISVAGPFANRLLIARDSVTRKRMPYLREKCRRKDQLRRARACLDPGL